MRPRRSLPSRRCWGLALSPDASRSAATDRLSPCAQYDLFLREIRRCARRTAYFPWPISSLFEHEAPAPLGLDSRCAMWSDEDLKKAKRIAAAVPGVTKVVDRMTIEREPRR
jgi:hypothetical protein